MIINNYEMPDDAKQFIHTSYSPKVFKEPKYKTPEERPAALIWRDAMRDTTVEAGMKDKQWPIHILSSLAKNLGWNWDAKHSSKGEEVIFDPSEIVALARSACGIDGIPSGNINITLNLRSYQDHDSDIGGYDWWQKQKNIVADENPFVAAFLSKLTDMLYIANQAGVGIFTEQMSLVVAKDGNSPIATLTPTLHSDLYYGERESTLCSILEPDYNPYGGTLSAPTLKMTAFKEHLPVEISKLLEISSDIPLLKVNSGDVMLHDGMIGPDGNAVQERGLPHISPDIPGKSSRIIFLMRHRSLSNRL